MYVDAVITVGGGQMVVVCPFGPHLHLHGTCGNDAQPCLGSRSADCGCGSYDLRLVDRLDVSALSKRERRRYDAFTRGQN